MIPLVLLLVVAVHLRGCVSEGAPCWRHIYCCCAHLAEPRHTHTLTHSYGGSLGAMFDRYNKEVNEVVLLEQGDTC